MRINHAPTIAGAIAVLAYLLIGLAACSGLAPLRPVDDVYPLSRLTGEVQPADTRGPSADDPGPWRGWPAPGQAARRP